MPTFRFRDKSTKAVKEEEKLHTTTPVEPLTQEKLHTSTPHDPPTRYYIEHPGCSPRSVAFNTQIECREFCKDESCNFLGQNCYYVELPGRSPQTHTLIEAISDASNEYSELSDSFMSEWRLLLDKNECGLKRWFNCMK